MAKDILVFWIRVLTCQNRGLVMVSQQSLAFQLSQHLDRSTPGTNHSKEDARQTTISSSSTQNSNKINITCILPTC